MLTSGLIADLKVFPVQTPSGQTKSALEQFCQAEMAAPTITALIQKYGLLPKLLQEMLVEQTISQVVCTPEDLQVALQQFYEAHGIKSPEAIQAWMRQTGMKPEQLQQQIERNLRLERYKQETWGHRLESHFLSQKPQLDKITYSLLRLQDFAMAQELFFRIQSGEQSFADAAREYAQGAEAQTGGLIGPTPMSQPHPTLAARLKAAKPGQVLPPIKVGDWSVILRLEEFIDAQFDQTTQQKLMEQLFQSWLQESVTHLMAQFFLNELPSSSEAL
jgi:parvulin-like peptidyl-prolyl isomerase